MKARCNRLLSKDCLSHSLIFSIICIYIQCIYIQYVYIYILCSIYYILCSTQVYIYTHMQQRVCLYIDILYIPIYQFNPPVAFCFWGFTVPKSSQIDPFQRQVSGEDSSNPSWTPGSSKMVHIKTMVGEAKIQFAGGHHEFCLDMLI